MRQEVFSFCQLGTLPSERGASPELVKQFQQHLLSIATPVSDEEARALVLSFGDDGCFGLSSSLIGVIETAPNWPIADCLQSVENESISRLRQRAINGGYGL